MPHLSLRSAASASVRHFFKRNLRIISRRGLRVVANTVVSATTEDAYLPILGKRCLPIDAEQVAQPRIRHAIWVPLGIDDFCAAPVPTRLGQAYALKPATSPA
jgi:hypothetical protein